MRYEAWDEPLMPHAPCLMPNQAKPRCLLRLRMFVDALDGVFHLANLLRFVIGDLDAELFLERHDQLDRVERVCAEVFDEGCIGLDLVRVDSKLLDDD